jgi:hypothetical protein
MQFYLHRDYVKSAAPRSGASVRDVIAARSAKAPPSPWRGPVAALLAGLAGRVDRESARRVLAS